MIQIIQTRVSEGRPGSVLWTYPLLNPHSHGLLNTLTHTRVLDSSPYIGLRLQPNMIHSSWWVQVLCACWWYKGITAWSGPYGLALTTIPWLYFLKIYWSLLSHACLEPFADLLSDFFNILQHLAGYCSRRYEAGFTVSRSAVFILMMLYHDGLRTTLPKMPATAQSSGTPIWSILLV